MTEEDILKPYMSYPADHFSTWRGWLWRFISLIWIKAYFKIKIPYTVQGRENVPKQGPYIIAANHISLLDPPIVGLSVNYPVAFMAKKELFSTPLGRWFFKLVGTFALNRDTPDLTTIKTALNVLKSPGKWALCLFPEGTRSLDGEVLPFKKGVVSIAHKAKVPILPIGIRKDKETGIIHSRVGHVLLPDGDIDQMQAELYQALVDLSRP